MGLPIVRLLLATNENDILHQFFQTGVYARRASVIKTISPSMDIQVASNFERFLYYVHDCNPEVVTKLMEDLKKTGKFEVSAECLERCRSEFQSAK